MTSLTTAAANLNTALGAADAALRQFTRVHDMAMSEGVAIDRRTLESLLMLTQQAQAHWGTDTALNHLASAERLVKSALGMEGE